MGATCDCDRLWAPDGLCQAQRAVSKRGMLSHVCRERLDKKLLSKTYTVDSILLLEPTRLKLKVDAELGVKVREDYKAYMDRKYNNVCV
jgi:hypothetical protein